MPNQPVRIPVDIYSLTLWTANKLKDIVQTWAMLTVNHRIKVNHAIRLLVDDVRDIASLRCKEVTLYPTKLRGTIALVQNLSSAVHSARRVMTDDRRRALGLIAKARKGLEAHVQLDLFAPPESRDS
jgi:hypothetical protein